MIKTFFIDVGQVLVTLDFAAALRKTCEHTRLTPEEIQRRMTWHKDVKPYECGRISTKDFYERTRCLLEMEVDLETFELVWREIFSGEAAPGQLVSAELFSLLRSRYQVVALSNTNEMHWRYLYENYPAVRDFDDYVLSFEVGAVKPDAAIFQAALRQTGRGPEETFFVDDQAVNIAAAETLGMRGVVFTGEAALRRDLARLGLLPAGAAD